MLRKYIILIILTSCIFQISKASCCKQVSGLIDAMKANNFAKFKDIYEENKDQRCTLTAHLHKVLYEENIINLVDLLNPEFKSFVGDQVKETLESIKKFREENPGYKGGAAEYHGELLPFIVDIYGQPLDRYGTIIKPRK